MSQKIKIRRGLKADLPSSADIGEFLYVTDTKEIFLGDGTGNPLVQVKHKNNLSATTNPTINDDSDQEYSINSLWFNLSLDSVFICTDATLGYAIWKPITDSIKNNYTATVNPLATDDISEGYSVGSVWLNAITLVIYKCVSATANAAIWHNINTYFNNYSATTDPSVNNDNTEGYHVGSLWVNINGYTLFECFSATTGAAYWRNVHTNKNNYSASVDPTVNNDIAQGYVPGSEWFNTTSGNMFQCLSNTSSAAVWKQVNAITSHNNLSGLQGGASNDYYHLTSAQVTSIGNKANKITGGTTDDIVTRDSGGDIQDSGKKFNDSGTGTGDVWSASKVQTAINAVLGANDAMIYKGVIDASTNPNYPAADAGHTYKISVAGKIGGASGLNVEIGDLILCCVDSTASGNQATVGTNWDIIQMNIDGAVTSADTSAVDGQIVLESGASGKVIKKSLVTIDSSGNINLPSGAKYKINGTNLASADIGAMAVSTYDSNADGKVNSADAADKLTNARNIALTGDVTGNQNFDGSGNISIASTLKNTGTAGTYTKVTTDAQGRVSSGANLGVSDIPTDSTHRFTNDTDITKLAGIAAGATKVESSTTDGYIKINGTETKVATVFKNNFFAITDPAVGNDTIQGYSIGSQWLNTATSTLFECISSTTGAAVWKIINNVKTNFSAITDPTIYSDSTQGYSIGSGWINTVTHTYFVCLDNTVGAANWSTPINSNVFYGTISGCRLIYNSDTAVNVNAGSIDIMGYLASKETITTIDLINNLDIGTTRTANTWYYIYVERSGGTFTAFISIQPPTRDRWGNTINPNASISRYHPTRNARFVGSILTNASSNITEFRLTSTYVAYIGLGSNYAITSVTSSRKAAVKLTTDVPLTANLINLYYETVSGSSTRQIGDWYNYILKMTSGTTSTAIIPLSFFDASLGKTATASTNNSQAANAVNGSVVTPFWTATSRTNQWLQVDLGSATYIDTVKIYENGANITSFNIQYYNGSSWITVYTGTTIAESAYKTYTFAGVTAQLWRIYIPTTSPSNASLAEISFINDRSVLNSVYYISPTDAISLGVLGYYEDI